MRFINIIPLLLTACLSSLYAEPIEHLRLVWIEKPSTEAMIVWDSSAITKKDSIEVWHEKSEKKTFEATPAKKYTDKNGEYFYRHIKMTGLLPGTTYQMKAMSDGVVSRTYQFRTAPADDAAFKLVYVGDSRTRPKIAKQISAQIGEMAHKDEEILAVIHGGDFANSPNLKNWKPWLDAWDSTTHPESGRLLPIIPVVGNHESPKRSPMYGEAYGFPGGKDRYLYSCDLSPIVRIAVLNSEMPSTGPQEAFLKETLETYKKDKVLWQLAAFHRPVYPAVKKPSGLKRLVPLFEEYLLDLVLESDGHCIKRTVPILAEKQHPEGVVYLGEGGYGAPQRNTKDQWYLKKPGFASKGDHSMLLRFSKDEIQYQTIGIDGKILDKATFSPRER